MARRPSTSTVEDTTTPTISRPYSPRWREARDKGAAGRRDGHLQPRKPAELQPRPGAAELTAAPPALATSWWSTRASDDGREASPARRAGLGVRWGGVGCFGGGGRAVGAKGGAESVLEVVDAVLELEEPADRGGGEALLGELDDSLELADLPAGVAPLPPVGPPRVDEALALPATQRGWGDPEHVGDLRHRVERVVGVVGGQAPSFHAFMIPLRFREESCRGGNRFRAAPG